MIPPSTPENEEERLKELETLSILDTLEEADFDNLTAIASQICGTPIALVSLIDEKRQWFKSHHGLPVSETPREYAFCAHAINKPDEPFVITDSRKDQRFHDNPLVTGDPRVIFYAGVPLVTESGMALGTLCVIDHKPREISEAQLKTLMALSSQVVNLLKLRKRELQLENAISVLTSKNEELDKFAFIAAHDLSSPLKNITSLTQLFIENHADEIPDDASRILELIGTSAEKLRQLVDGLLQYSRNDSILQESKTVVNIDEIKSYVTGLLAASPNVTLEWKTQLNSIYTNKTALHQIIINLVTNALKYGGGDGLHVTIGASEKNGYYHIYVKDNGPGIKEKFHERIFNIFTTIPSRVKGLQPGNGIGLSTVKKLTESLGGSIKVESKPDEGATFYITLKK